MNPVDTRHKLHLIFGYLSCTLLVIFYVNLFSLYRLVKGQFGTGVIFWAPVILPPALLLFFLLKSLIPLSKIKKKSRWAWIGAGTALCLGALCIPDPQIAIKRIHVTEYLLLSLLARYTLSHHYSEQKLLLFSALFAALLGVHDEFLQGLHPTRTYGLRDMSVNICAAIGGSLIWHGLCFFSAGKDLGSNKNEQKIFIVICLYLAWLTLAIAALAIPTSGYLNSSIPVWTTLPLTVSLLLFVMYRPTIQNSVYSHGVSVLTYTAMVFLLYPLLVHALSTPFY